MFDVLMIKNLINTINVTLFYLLFCCAAPSLYLRDDDVGSREGGNLPARDDAADDGPDQAQDPDGHTCDLNRRGAHPSHWRREEGGD